MIVAVTGGSGHLGANLLGDLARLGHEVTVLVHRDRKAFEGVSAKLLRGDVLEPSSLVAAFEGAEVVIHLAAAIAVTGESERLLEPVNVQGTRNVVEACLRAGVKRLVHMSSVHAFCQHPMNEPIDENRALADTSPCQTYDRTKALAERVVLEGLDRGLDVVILNPSGMLGPNDFKLSRMGETLIMLHRGQIPMLVPGGYDWVDVRDVATTTIAAMDRGRSGERYILSGHWASVTEIAAHVSRLSGKKPPSTTVPMWMARLGAPFVEYGSRLARRRPIYTRGALDTLASNSRFVGTKARNELGHSPRPLEETIADACHWHGMARKT